MELDPAALEQDAAALAQAGVRAGLLGQEVMNVISLHPQVPNSMKHRYLVTQLYDKVLKNDRDYFARVVQVLSQFQPQPKIAQSDTPLAVEHVSDLTEILAGYKYKWSLIGTALRFQDRDLKNIQANNATAVDPLLQSLIQMLNEWVEKVHKHVLPPTVGHLDKALNSLIVGLGALTPGLKKFAGTPSDALPYLMFNVHVENIDGQIRTTTRNTENLQAEENGSVLLEIQVTSSNCDGVEFTHQCQWLCNGIAIEESPSTTGTRTLFLCLSKISLDLHRSVYSCLVKINNQNFFTTKSATLLVSCDQLDKFTDSLTSLYLAQPEVPEDTWPPLCCKRHVRLALINHKSDKGIDYGSEYVRLTVRKDIDDILQHKERIEYDDLLKGLRSGQVLFIEGRPGCGKTTFVHKIAQDWAAGTKGVIRLMLLVSLRVLNNLYLVKPTIDLSDILKLFKDLKVSKELLEHRSGRGVCLIFDGLDEFSPSDGKESIVYKIINKQYLSSSIVIVASRPTGTARIRARANKVVEVLGFVVHEVFQFVECYPFSDVAKSAQLKAYLTLHPNILHMCYLPIHVAMVAYIFKMTGRVPRTETEIYTIFTRFTLMRGLSKHRDVDDIDIENLSEQENLCFMQICRLALAKTILNRQVLRQDEVGTQFKRESGKDISLGLITIDRTAGLYGFKDVYTFLHLTFQEYLAACCLSKLSKEEQIQCLLEHGVKNHMMMVWKFCCGLRTFDEALFAFLLKETDGRLLYQIQCAYESQQPSNCTLLMMKTDYHVQIVGKYLSTPDFTAIGYVMNASDSPTKLSLKDCNLNIEAIDAVVSEMDEKSKDLLQSLQFEAQSFDATEKLCIDKLLITLKSLKCVAITATRASSLSQDGNTTACGDFQILTDIPYNNLHELTLVGNHSRVNNANAELLAANLRHCSQLRLLCLDNNVFGDTETVALGLQYCHNLCDLSIKGIGISRSSASILATSLRHCTKLRRLDLSYNDGLSKGDAMKSLVACLNHLEDLDLSHCGLGAYGAQILAANLHNYAALKRIVVSHNQFRNSGCEVIANSLRQCSKLEYVDLNNNEMDSATEKAVQFSLQNSHIGSNIVVLCHSDPFIGIDLFIDTIPHAKRGCRTDPAIYQHTST